MKHEHNTAEESGAILERLRILDEIEAVEQAIWVAGERSILQAELAELTAQLWEVDR